MISRRRFVGILTTALGVFGLARTVQACEHVLWLHEPLHGQKVCAGCGTRRSLTWADLERSTNPDWQAQPPTHTHAQFDQLRAVMRKIHADAVRGINGRF